MPARWTRKDIQHAADQRGKDYSPRKCDGGILTVDYPFRLVNELNARTHWRVRYQRAKGQRQTIAATIPRAVLPKLPVVVTITRTGPQLLDEGDNLAASAKHVRDAIADLYGKGDNDASVIEWRYAQNRGMYGCRIEIAPKRPA